MFNMFIYQAMTCWIVFVPSPNALWLRPMPDHRQAAGVWLADWWSLAPGHHTMWQLAAGRLTWPPKESCCAARGWTPAPALFGEMWALFVCEPALPRHHARRCLHAPLLLLTAAPALPPVWWRAEPLSLVAAPIDPLGLACATSHRSGGLAWASSILPSIFGNGAPSCPHSEK